MILIKRCPDSLKLCLVISLVGAVLTACGGSSTKSSSSSSSTSSSQAVSTPAAAPTTNTAPSSTVTPATPAAPSPATVATAAAVVSAGNSVPASANQCDDGIDNDGDGLVDWQYDVGCSDANDTTEVGLSRTEEDGWTTFNLSADSRVVYVSSSEGSDSNDGLTPSAPVATLEKGSSLVRNGFPDYLLLKRGDVWRDQNLGTFKSGRSVNERMVVSSYGDSIERPKIELGAHSLIYDLGRVREHLAFVGLEITSYKQEPGSPDFEGLSIYGLHFVGEDRDNNILVEDNYFKYAFLVMGAANNIEVRRNIVYKAYRLGGCPGQPRSGVLGSYLYELNNSLIEENLYDGNGWNEDLPKSGTVSSCGSLFNHNIYLVNAKNTTIKNNIFLRSSSMGIKVSSNNINGVDNVQITDNLFAEGEIGISMSGNYRGPLSHLNSEVSNNVFTDVGRTMPTGRELSWGIWISNNDNTVYRNNLFVNPLQVANSSALNFTNDYNSNVTVENNTAHGYSGAVLNFDEGPNWSGLDIKSNSWSSKSYLIIYSGDFANSRISYSNNEYDSDRPLSERFFVSGVGVFSLDQWMAASGETNSVTVSNTPSDVGRNVDSYANFLGVGTTINDFSVEARKQSRFNYRSEYEAMAVNSYIREGYTP